MQRRVAAWKLAEWITHQQHPLTARVMVNRVWQHLFGEGLVRTPDDFGVYGEKPTHPLLLDHLATRFMAENWSIKQLVRRIVLSRAYQLSSRTTPDLLKHDQENRLLARHHRRRLDAESFRDSVLVASGQLDLTPPEGSLVQHRDILVNLAGNLHQPSKHRSVYLCYLRNSPPPSLAAFNLPEFNTVTGKRDRTTVPGQALYLYNNPFLIEQSRHLANILLANANDDSERIRLAYLKILGRNPDKVEAEEASKLVASFNEENDDSQTIWSGLSQALLITNQFRYVD